MPKNVACAILIACEDEFERLKQRFTLKPERRRQGEPLYQSFSITDANAYEQTVIVRFFKSMGPSDARRETDQLLDRYGAKLVVSLGVSGALADYLALGDIVIAAETDEYGHRGKAVKGRKPQTYEIVFGGRTFKTDRAHSDALVDIAQSHQMLFDSWRSDCVRSFPKGINREALIAASLLNEKPVIHTGPVACGDTVGATTTFKNRLKERNRNFLALDMESSGVMQSCYERGVTGIVIRVISDLADENKQALEADKYAVRNWASDNAYRLLEIALRNLYSFPPPNKKNAGRQNDLDSLEQQFHQLAVRNYLQDPFTTFTAANLSGFTPYHSLYLPITRNSREDPLLRTNLFEAWARYILGSAGPYPLRIDGGPGSGKTTFLSLLYLCLRLCRKSSLPPFIPIYIDLKHYREKGKEQIQSLRNDLSILKVLGQNASPVKAVFLIDGVEEYSGDSAELEAELFEMIDAVPDKRQVVGVALNFHYADAFRRDDLIRYERPDETVSLGALNVDDTRLDQFLDACLALAPHTALKPAREELHQTINAFRIESLDLHTLWLIVLHRKRQGFYQAQSLSDFYQEYCRQFLKKDIHKTAELAYRYSLQQDQSAQQQLLADARGWKLFHSHSSIRDFLIAAHAIQLIQRCAKNSDSTLLDGMSYIFPQQISRFSKEIVNEDETSQANVLKTTQIALSAGHYNSLPWLCYLVGRVESARLKGKANEVLKACLAWARQSSNVAETASGGQPACTQLVLRTAYISLVSLGNEYASNEYIDLMFQNTQADNLNRSFHLEYYGDIPYTPLLEMDHQDPLDDFPNTFRNLYARLSRNIDEAKRYPAGDIEMYTLLALAQHRHEQGRLNDKYRRSLAGLISRCLTRIDTKPESETLQRYMEMMKRNLEFESFGIGQIAEQFYRIKTVKRAGWLARGHDDAESVADHMYGAFLLGLTYLPETAPATEGYDKREILDMLLIHDLGEADTGDVLPGDFSELQRQKERRAYEYIGALQTYAGVGNLERIKTLWENFEQKTSINARIANDIDKLENLMQLYVYQRQGHRIERAAEWQRALVDDVETAIGRDVLEIIRRQFPEGRKLPLRR